MKTKILIQNLTMEASTVFKELLSKMENSQLNYVISKTPFSANIIIKSSFIKYYDVRSSTDPVVKDESEKIKGYGDLVILKKQNRELEDLLGSEKDKVKSLEDQIGDFREKLLEIKRDRNELNVQLKSHKSQLADLRGEQMKIQEANRDLETKLVLKNKNLNVKHSEIKEINKENDNLKAKLDQCMKEFNSFKLETNHMKKKQASFECNFCAMIFDSGVELSQHVRDNHVKHQVSQTKITDVEMSTQTEETYEVAECEYPCFYCGQMLTSSESSLSTHLSECPELGLLVDDLNENENNEPNPSIQTSLPPPSLPPLLFAPPFHPPHPFSPFVGFPREVSCNSCHEKFPHEVVLKRHYSEVHPEITLFWCNVCWTHEE